MKERGLTGFQLKITGLLLMIFDHIHEFFSFSGNIPVAFKWVGRIVAPIFIFMTVEGYTHTRNKKKYMLRLYLASVLMNIGNYLIPKYFERIDSLALMNNIFATLFVITVYLCIVDFITKAIKEKNEMKIFLGGILFILPIALSIFLMINVETLIYLIFLIPTPIFVEGGPIFVLIGIIMYLLRGDRKKLLIAYIVMCLAVMFTGDLSVKGLFFNNYQWMMAFAAPLFYLYNGKKGKGMKYLFYLFYPTHIYIFYIISCYVMNR
ncbi:conjugal transfer protein TraX [Clostridium sp. MSJ-11]|uniref:Conjugal transfer protein TraX n=1 Tax=Clostridium mobile TaxID=2841512 RepID=A0ABS6EHE9_9CLOT|nr:TraX family protein [Clostridium mobile]MBU5484637.1 conjugal transfer protein TraX [Clostridium mobile]